MAGVTSAPYACWRRHLIGALSECWIEMGLRPSRARHVAAYAKLTRCTTPSTLIVEAVTRPGAPATASCQVARTRRLIVDYGNRCGTDCN